MAIPSSGLLLLYSTGSAPTVKFWAGLRMREAPTGQEAAFWTFWQVHVIMYYSFRASYLGIRSSRTLVVRIPNVSCSRRYGSLYGLRARPL